MQALTSAFTGTASLRPARFAAAAPGGGNASRCVTVCAKKKASFWSCWSGVAEPRAAHCGAPPPSRPWKAIGGR